MRLFGTDEQSRGKNHLHGRVKKTEADVKENIADKMDKETCVC